MNEEAAPSFATSFVSEPIGHRSRLRLYDAASDAAQAD
jgi:hypothetical protein